MVAGDGRGVAVQIAGDGSISIGLEERGGAFPTRSRDRRAASCELAAVVDGFRRRDGCGWLLGHPCPLGAGQWDRRQEELRVGMLGPLDHELYITDLDHRATIEHDD